MRATFVAIAAVLSCSAPAVAGFTLSTTTGFAVDRVDLHASFDSVARGKVGTYSEGGLALIVSNSRKTGFGPDNDSVEDGEHFGNKGKADFLTLIAADDGYFEGVELALTAGFVSALPKGLFYEVVRDGNVLDFGFSDLTNGTIAGFRFTQGFDELRLAAAYASGSNLTSPPISIHNVSAQSWQCSGAGSPDASPVPEPMSLTMIGTGLGFWAFRRRVFRRKG